MTALILSLTDAGLAAVEGASGADPVTIAELALTATPFTVAPTLTALPGEFKRIAAIAGTEAAPNITHMTAYDTSADVWNATGFGLFLADGTLFAVYSSATTVINKAAPAFALIAFDIAFNADLAASIAFGDPVFTNPPATPEMRGVVELATVAEAQAGIDALRALTPEAGKAAVLGWLLTQDGAGSLLDADKLDGYDSADFVRFAQYTAASVLSRLITVDGSGSGIDADLLDGLNGSDYLRIVQAQLAGTGFVKFSNGLYLLWGATSFSGSGAATNIDYATEMGTAIPLTSFSRAIATGGYTGDADHNTVFVTDCSPTGFSAYNRSTGSSTGFWFAIGF